MEFSSFLDWKKKLIEYGNRENVVILVEGKRDESVLRNWGIVNILSLKGKRFYDIVEQVEFTDLCILLFDLDKQGEKIFQKLKSMLMREGIPVNETFREYLKNFDIKEIEELSTLDTGGINVS